MTVTLNLAPLGKLDDDQFYELCRLHPELRLERTARGELVVMPPVGGESGHRNGQLTQQLFNWSEADGSGLAFDSSTGFRLPDGAQRSPDAAWVARDRWEALTRDQRRRFPPLCPDFVVELLSPSDELAQAQGKLREFLENGARLGWLVDVERGRVEVYRPGQPVEVLRSPAEVSGEDVLPGFVLRLAGWWSD